MNISPSAFNLRPTNFCVNGEWMGCVISGKASVKEAQTESETVVGGGEQTESDRNWEGEANCGKTQYAQK